MARHMATRRNKGKKSIRKSAAKRTRSAGAGATPAVVRFNANLFSADVAKIAELAKGSAISSTLYARQLVHDALNPLKGYKFFVRADEKVTIPLGEIDPLTGDYPKDPISGAYLNGVHEISDQCAACVAHSQGEALALLEAYAAHEGLDSRWLKAAPHKVEIALSGPAFIMWAAH